MLSDFQQCPKACGWPVSDKVLYYRSKGPQSHSKRLLATRLGCIPWVFLPVHSNAISTPRGPYSSCYHRRTELVHTQITSNQIHIMIVCWRVKLVECGGLTTSSTSGPPEFSLLFLCPSMTVYINNINSVFANRYLHLQDIRSCKVAHFTGPKELLPDRKITQRHV